MVNEIFDEADDAPDKKRNAGPLALILIALALVAAIFAFANPFADKESKLPEASFVRQEIDGKLHFKNTSQAYGKDNSIVMSEWSVFSVSENGKKKLKTSEDDNLDLIIKTPAHTGLNSRFKMKTSSGVFLQAKSLTMLLTI